MRWPTGINAREQSTFMDEGPNIVTPLHRKLRYDEYARLPRPKLVVLAFACRRHATTVIPAERESMSVGESRSLIHATIGFDLQEIHAARQSTMARTVQCVKLREEAEGLDFPPLPGGLGKRVFENVSKPAWQQWLTHQTMLINENRLKVTDPEARRFLEGELEKYFFGEGSATPEGYVPRDG